MTDESATPAAAKTGPGLPYALGAYTLWGMIPLYFVLLNPVDSFALVGWRIIWTIPICLVLITLRRQWPDIRAVITAPRVLGTMVLSSVLISVNWLVYIMAVQDGQFFAASLGYYINPLVNVLLGTLLLKEKLSRLQWIAVGTAGIGVAVLAVEAGTTLFISLTLAFSFAFYGLLRKRTPVGALPGLTIEVLVLAIPSAIAIMLAPPSPPEILGVPVQLMLLGAGLWTGIPLLLFATAARRMDYSTLGFVQFLAPTLVFIFGLTILGEELDWTRLICFVFIWVAIAIFCADLLLRRRKAVLRPA